jgi:hypothetical protein
MAIALSIDAIADRTAAMALSAIAQPLPPSALTSYAPALAKPEPDINDRAVVIALLLPALASQAVVLRYPSSALR